ncbi:hypothetical protein HJFPF1_03518 [Paramyrothecium foliicola]|nr:hypothetical protein HJFPF1_03518 [Paramyrothecium foliicola]
MHALPLTQVLVGITSDFHSTTIMSLKDRISSPLEAGTSILDAHHLPPHIHPALEYASSRLAKKSLHITLVVVRRDFQLPSVFVPLASPGLQTPTTPSSPPLSSNRYHLHSSPVAAFKQLMHSASASLRSNDNIASGPSSPAFPNAALESPRPRLRWPLSPTLPMSPPPMTPSTMSFTTSADTRSTVSSSSFGMRLVYASPLPEKAEKALKDALEKADKKFSIGSQWLSPAVSPGSCGLSNQLIRSSIIQNEPLYSSEGLTLLSLDRLYSVKSALSSYSKTRSHTRLEDAVDELRRYILANNGKKATKADLLRSYDWLNVKTSALLELDRMYRRAYGGPEQIGGIAGMSAPTVPVIPEPAIKADEDDDSDAASADSDSYSIPFATVQLSKPPSPRGPALKLHTAFAASPINRLEAHNNDNKELHNPTVSKFDETPTTLRPPHSPATSRLQGGRQLGSFLLSPDQDAAQLGPLTPNGYDDISPITRGEWGFLMIDDAFQGRKTAAVETC